MTALPTFPQNAADEAAAYRGGHAYVSAGPGTGKTRLLVERYRQLRAEGVPAAQILVLTFSRRAVQELRERLLAAGFHAGEGDVRTFHGFAARTIGGGIARFRDGRLLDGFSRALVLEAALEATPTPSLTDAVRRSDGFRRDLTRLLDDLGRTPEIADLDGASPRVHDLLAILARVRAERAAVGGRDLGDLVGHAVAELRAPDSPGSRWLHGRYRHVLIDEFQDSDPLQLDLLDQLAREAMLFAVGDEAQSIYRFRGAGDGIVAQAVRRWSMQPFALTQSQRCPPDVCALASASPIEGLSTLTSARTEGETVRVARVRRVDDEARFLADAIETALEHDTPAEEMAVLLRSFRPIGPLLVDELRQRGIPVAATGREELLADPRVGALRAALDVFAAPDRPDRWVRLLTAPPLGYEGLALRFAGDALARLRLDDTLPAALETVCRGGAIPARQLGEGLLFAAASWRDGKLATTARRLVRRLGLLAATLRDEPPLAVRAAAGRLRLVCDALRDAQATAERLGIPASCRDLVGRFDDLLPMLALDDAGLDPAAAGVRVLTVHAAKGLEFRHVFLADAVNGRFPQASRPSTLLSVADRTWLAQRGINGPFIVDGAEREEASLWYVAVTRAMESLTIVLSEDGLDGSRQAPSRFIPAERIPDAIVPVEREDLMLRALHLGDPALRDRLIDAGAFAKAPALAAYARSGPAAFAPVAMRPLRRERPLSVSDIETWLACPRRVFYRRFANLTEPSSEALDLGSMLHAALEQFHERHTEFRDVAGQATAWTAELLELRQATWDASRFRTPLIEQAAARRADVALRGYARALEAHARQRPFRVERREMRVSVDVGPHTVAGRIDRVDVDAQGGRTIVDYKSGNAKTKSLEKTIGSVLEEWDEAEAAALPRPRIAGAASSTLTVQLPLYATAFTGAAAVAYVYLGGVYELAQRDGAVFEVTELGDPERRFTTGVLAELREDFLDPLAEGRLTTLPVAQTKDQCRFCFYTGICPGPKGTR